MTDPITTAIPLRLRDRFDPRPGLHRVRESAIAIVQIVVAATAAFAFAHYVLGHPTPLLAATVTVSSLGLVRDARPRRVLETVVGMLVGIFIAEVLLMIAGTGWWQLGLTLGLTLVVARFLSKQAAFAIAASIQSLIVMVLPAVPGAPFLRLIDGALGAVAALLVTALIPRSPRRTEVREAKRLFAAFDASILTIAQALRRGDRLRADRGLTKARAIEPIVAAWRESLESGVAIARISPFLRRQREAIDRDAQVLAAMDLAVRNLRVVGRRAVYLCDDRQARPVVADLLLALGRGAALVSDALDDISLAPIARESLAAVAAHLDPLELLPDASLGDQNLVSALRPLCVDLLVASGMPRVDAARAVPRI